MNLSAKLLSLLDEQDALETSNKLKSLVSSEMTSCADSILSSDSLIELCSVISTLAAGLAKVDLELVDNLLQNVLQVVLSRPISFDLNWLSSRLLAYKTRVNVLQALGTLPVAYIDVCLNDVKVLLRVHRRASPLEDSVINLLNGATVELLKLKYESIYWLQGGSALAIKSDPMFTGDASIFFANLLAKPVSTPEMYIRLYDAFTEIFSFAGTSLESISVNLHLALVLCGLRLQQRRSEVRVLLDAFFARLKIRHYINQLDVLVGSEISIPEGWENLGKLGTNSTLIGGHGVDSRISNFYLFQGYRPPVINGKLVVQIDLLIRVESAAVGRPASCLPSSWECLPIPSADDNLCFLVIQKLHAHNVKPPIKRITCLSCLKKLPKFQIIRDECSWEVVERFVKVCSAFFECESVEFVNRFAESVKDSIVGDVGNEFVKKYGKIISGFCVEIARLTLESLSNGIDNVDIAKAVPYLISGGLLGSKTNFAIFGLLILTVRKQLMIDRQVLISCLRRLLSCFGPLQSCDDTNAVIKSRLYVALVQAELNTFAKCSTSLSKKEALLLNSIGEEGRSAVFAQVALCKKNSVFLEKPDDDEFSRFVRKRILQ